jgi:hypothetical protein
VALYVTFCERFSVIGRTWVAHSAPDGRVAPTGRVLKRPDVGGCVVVVGASVVVVGGTVVVVVVVVVGAVVVVVEGGWVVVVVEAGCVVVVVTQGLFGRQTGLAARAVSTCGAAMSSVSESPPKIRTREASVAARNFFTGQA